MDTTAEFWKTVPSFPDYEISNLGRLRRATPAAGARVGRILKQSPGTHGYPVVRIRRDGVYFNVNVHRMVAEAFLGPRPDGCEVNHKDSNRANSSLTNLEYLTHKKNMEHAVAATGFNRGEKNGNKKFTKDDVLQIVAMLQAGASRSSVAKAFNAGETTVRQIHLGERWSWLTGIAKPTTGTCQPTSARS